MHKAKNQISSLVSLHIGQSFRASIILGTGQVLCWSCQSQLDLSFHGVSSSKRLILTSLHSGGYVPKKRVNAGKTFLAPRLRIKRDLCCLLLVTKSLKTSLNERDGKINAISSWEE